MLRSSMTLLLMATVRLGAAASPSAVSCCFTMLNSACWYGDGMQRTRCSTCKLAHSLLVSMPAVHADCSEDRCEGHLAVAQRLMCQLGWQVCPTSGMPWQLAGALRC